MHRLLQFGSSAKILILEKELSLVHHYVYFEEGLPTFKATIGSLSWAAFLQTTRLKPITNLSLMEEVDE